jgi:hypothetical protein
MKIKSTKQDFFFNAAEIADLRKPFCENLQENLLLFKKRAATIKRMLNIANATIQNEYLNFNWTTTI